MSDFVDRIDFLLSKQNKKRNSLYESVPGINAHSLYDWNRRNCVPAADTALKIAQYLNTTVEYLLTGTETISQKNEKAEKTIEEIASIIQSYKASQ